MGELVSVIIPAYNAEKFIGRALDSLIAQTYVNWQAVVINDGSTDATAEICKGYCKRDERIRLVSKENGGVSRARNAGLECADGEYICFLDADDYVEPGFIETLYNGIKSGNCMISACGFTRKNSAESEIGNFNSYTIEQAFYQMCQNKIIYPFIWNKMFLSSVIRSNSLRFDTELIYGEDTLFMLEYYACVYDGSLGYSDGCLYHYSLNSDSAIAKRNRGKFNPSWFDQIKALERAAEYAENKGLDDFAGAIKTRLCYVYPMVLELFVNSGCCGEEYKNLVARMRRELPEFLKSELFDNRTKRQMRVCARSPKLKHWLVKLKLL